jgi:biopolymer transport protein ExbD
MKFRTPARQALFAPLSHASDPVPQMNTTPLIDVLLVLLVILIITIPVQSHKVAIDLPPPGPAGVPPVIHRLTLAADGTTRWDGTAIDEATLKTRLIAHKADPAQPLLQMIVEAETPYVRFDRTLALVKREGVTKIGFAGNEAWGKF